MKVLVVDDEKEIASLFQDYLEMEGSHDVAVAHSGAEALQKLKQQKPDLIILDILMPGLTGFQVLGAIRRNPETSDIPVVLSSVTDGPSPKDNKQLGIVSFLRKPVDFVKLNQLVTNLDNSAVHKRITPSTPDQLPLPTFPSTESKGQEQGASVLLIEDDEEDVELITMGLKNIGCSVRSALDGQTGLRMANEMAPDLIILDYQLPVKSGLDVIKELKSSEKTCRIPVVLISAYIPSNTKGKLFMLREQPSNTKPVSAEDLCDRIKEIFTTTA